VLFANINLQSGALTLDPHRIDFDRRWPDGWNGPAMPHGSLFSRWMGESGSISVYSWPSADGPLMSAFDPFLPLPG